MKTIEELEAKLEAMTENRNHWAAASDAAKLKLEAVAKLPEKWRKEFGEFSFKARLVKCSQELEDALGPPPVVEPVPAVDERDEWLHKLARAVAEAVRGESAEEIRALTAQKAAYAERAESKHGCWMMELRNVDALEQSLSTLRAENANLAAKLNEERKIAANRLEMIQAFHEQIASKDERIDSQTAELANAKHWNAKQAEEIARLSWRPVSVKPTKEDADADGIVEIIEKGGKRRLIRWEVVGASSQDSCWRPFSPPPAPTIQDEMEAAYQASLKDTWMDVRQWNSKEAFEKGWYAGRAKEPTT